MSTNGSAVSLQEPIATYFQAKNSKEPGEILACFSDAAVIVDTGENTEMTGHDEIRKWLTGTISSYDLSTEVIRAADKEGETVVSALVSGNFPGSPIEFDYCFTIRDGKIERLVIQ